jgi:hypothetical protein
VAYFSFCMARRTPANIMSHIDTNVGHECDLEVSEGGLEAARLGICPVRVFIHNSLIEVRALLQVSRGLLPNHQRTRLFWGVESAIDQGSRTLRPAPAAGGPSLP